MHRLLASILVSAAAITAQSSICHSLSNNTVFHDATSMGGPNLLLAIKTVATVPLAVGRAEIWTGEATGTNQLALWSHDAANNKPLQSMGSASWNMARINGWQGANFTPPIPIQANTEFWLVWAPINGAQASIELNQFPNGLTYRGSFDGGQTWNGPFNTILWKFRLYCGGTPGHFEIYGSGCIGSNRARPELGVSGVPTLGQSTVLQLDRGLASSNAWLALGSSDTTWGAVTLPFNLGLIGAPNCLLLCSIDASLGTPVDANGQANLTLPIPNNPWLLGQTLFTQWIVRDVNANTLGLVVSQGGRLRIGD